MDNRELLKRADHTLLGQTATWAQIKSLLDDGIKYETASCCIPPSYVKQAADYVSEVQADLSAADRLAICTVIGFPNGYNTTAVKVAETADAVDNGADEIDMVINIGWVKDCRWDDLLAEIKAIKAACQGRLLKVIIETCYLTDEEKIKMCEIVTESGAEYIKTSTGFGTAGATFEDIKLFAEHIGENVKMKAAGGISSLEDAAEFVKLGASRLGTSRVVKIIKSQEQ